MDFGSQEPRPFVSVIPQRPPLQELIGMRLFDSVDALKAHGIDIFITRDLRRLVQLNQIHRESWAPLVPLFNPDEAGFSLDDAFLIEGRDNTGQTAFTDGVRLLHLANSNFKEELEGFRLHYRDPGSQKGPTETIQVTGTRAHQLSAGERLLSVEFGWRRGCVAAGLLKYLRRWHVGTPIYCGTWIGSSLFSISCSWKSRSGATMATSILNRSSVLIRTALKLPCTFYLNREANWNRM